MKVGRVPCGASGCQCHVCCVLLLVVVGSDIRMVR